MRLAENTVLTFCVVQYLDGYGIDFDKYDTSEFNSALVQILYYNFLNRWSRYRQGVGRGKWSLN